MRVTCAVTAVRRPAVPDLLVQDCMSNSFSSKRVVENLRVLAQRTGGPNGARRLCWTSEWLEARALLREQLSTLPLEVEQDEAGNLWAYLRGESKETIVIGSHLDSVPSGGWLDGALGVMAGLEVMRALCAGPKPARTIALVDWADEEGARFGRSLFGSAAVAGSLDLEVLAGLKDKNNTGLVETLAEHGVHLNALEQCEKRRDTIAAYLELHIEQGPVLEQMGQPIAVVTGTVGIERKRFIFNGQAAHAGTMPMVMRKDSLRAASRFILEVADIGVLHNGVTTVGSISCKPGVVTAVPGETMVTLDMRHIDATSLNNMLNESLASATKWAEHEGCQVKIEHIFAIDPMIFDPKLIEMTRQSIGEVHDTVVEIPSGALHDASEMARSIPTAMIFTSSTNGLSHTKEEDTPVEHLEMGCDAFWSLVNRVLKG